MTGFDMEDIDMAWCPGCGNFQILKALKEALVELEITPEDLVMVSGIGQAGKVPQYINAHMFNGLHGRSLSPATGIKASNPALTVITVSGDGCTYGEGGNHFIHTIRRNPDITNLVHNNMVYGLTKGQASPTSIPGFKTKVQLDGVFEEPFNPIAVAIALDAPFVSRAYAGDAGKTKEIIKEAITHEGYALVDIFQPCPSFNKTNTYKWFKENTYYLEDSHKPDDRDKAFKRATETEKLPLGIFYKNENRVPFAKNLNLYQKNNEPLYKRDTDMEKLKKQIDSMR